MFSWNIFSRIGIASSLVFLASHARAVDASSPAQEKCESELEIASFVLKTTPSPDGFCFHEVQDPSKTLVSQKPILKSKQLYQGLNIAFSNTKYRYEKIAGVCGSLGPNWNPAYVLKKWTQPHTTEIGNSAEALNLYLGGAVDASFWTGSIQNYNGGGELPFAFYIDARDDSTFWTDPTNQMFAICVSP